MLNRRNALCFLAALCTSVAARARAATAAEAASAFIRETSDKLIAVVNGAGSPEARRQALAPIISSAVDVVGVARFCLGRFWRTATPEQQEQYLRLFHSVLVTNISLKLGEYRGVRVIMGRTQSRDDGELVSTTVDRPNNPPTTVQWLITDAETNPKVIDVIAEGTSLRLTQREDYASFLSHNGNSINVLLEAMRKQLEQTG